MRLVIDASVAVKWVIPSAGIEPDADRAAILLDAARAVAIEIVQPPHWLAEVAAVVSRLRPQTALQAIDMLNALDVAVASDADIYKRASRIAAHTGQHLFDTLYHAVAFERDATLVTADGRYLRKAWTLGRVLSLAEWNPPAAVDE